MYTKLENQMPGIADGLDSVLADEKITNQGLRDALLASGVTVELTDGQQVWVACVPNDDPTTHHIEFLAVAIAGDETGPTVRPNGHVVATLFNRGIAPTVVASTTIPVIRKAMMMVTLGLEPEIDMGLTEATSAERSIRTKLTVLSGIQNAHDDVL